MNKSRKYWRFVHICTSILAGCILFACDNKEEELVFSFDVEGSGDVSFSISGAEDEGIGTAVVEKGDTLNMVISQRSSYTDSDGSVMTCEPKATITLYAKLDTIYSESLKTLLDINKNPNIQKSQTGTTPLLCRTLQTFNIGGQEITFDFTYEKYSLTNRAGEQVEMPYVKVNPAQYGAANTAEEDAVTRVAVSAITLKPIVQTRGIIKDSTLYDVTVKFNQEVESVNTKSDSKETLSFEVNYVGVVENSREFPDPEMSFNYEFKVLRGTKSSSSPFLLTLGDTLSLQWQQSSKYTYFP